MQDETWGIVRQDLREAVGPHNFRHWIEPLRFVRAEAGVATFEAPTGFVGAWVANNFGAEIRRRLKAAGAEIHRLAFEVGGGAEAVQAPAEPPADAVGPLAATLAGAALDPRCTFDSFVVGRPNALAAAAARRVADGQVTFNPLYLYGGVGLGKTHLMHAIAWDLRERRPELNVVYLSAEQFMFRFVQALRERRMMDFKELFRAVDVLLIDDVQFIAGKDSTQEEFFHTFNALVDQGKQVIVAANRPPAEIARLEERIASRLQCGLMVDLRPADHDLRLRMLRARLAVRAADYPGVEVEGEVLEMLARRVTSNLRVLEGRADAGAGLRLAHRPADHGRVRLRLPRRRAARLGPAARHGRDPGPRRRALRPQPERSAGPQAGARGGPAAPGGDVSRQDADRALAARDRPLLRRARPHHRDPRGAADRGAARHRRAHRARRGRAAPRAPGLRRRAAPTRAPPARHGAPCAGRAIG